MRISLSKITTITFLLGIIFFNNSVKGQFSNEINNSIVNSEIPDIGSRLELFTDNYTSNGHILRFRECLEFEI